MLGGGRGTLQKRSRKKGLQEAEVTNMESVWFWARSSTFTLELCGFVFLWDSQKWEQGCLWLFSVLENLFLLLVASFRHLFRYEGLRLVLLDLVMPQSVDISERPALCFWFFKENGRGVDLGVRGVGGVGGEGLGGVEEGNHLEYNVWKSKKKRSGKKWMKWKGKRQYKESVELRLNSFEKTRLTNP